MCVCQGYLVGPAEETGASQEQTVGTALSSAGLGPDTYRDTCGEEAAASVWDIGTEI